MTNSMTAFARNSTSLGCGELSCELRSVNHRYLELNPRISEELRYLEPQIRELLASHLKRGRIDCYLRFQAGESELEDFQIQSNLVEKVAGLSQQLIEQYPHLNPMNVSDLMNWPGVIHPQVIDIEALEDSVMDLIRQTVERLCLDRQREGGRLQLVVLDRLDQVEGVVGDLVERLPELMEGFRHRIIDRLEEVKSKLDPERLEQELVLYVQKSDVSEELDRLKIHIDEVRRVINAKGAVGRRLDFLMQELNREANTLGAKAFDSVLTQSSVDLKVSIEQMREQIQNIE